MIWFLQLLLILIGIISSLICGFFVSKSFYQHFVLSLPSITTTTATTTESIEENSSINYWKLNPDPSFLDTFNYLPAWGSYRPGYYFGMKSRESSLTSGIAWLDPTRQHFRHEAQQDEIKQLDWIEHDGIHYGKQILSDIQSNIQLETSFIVPTSAPSSSSSSSSSSFSWIQKFSITRLQNFLSNDFRTFPFYNYFGSDCFRNDRNCLDLSTLNNIKLLTKGFKDDHILFTLMGQNERKEWLLFQVFVNQTDAIESFSFQTSSEKNVFQGIQQLKTESTNQYERVIRNKNELWLDEFGELKNEIVRNGKIKFTVLQLKIRQPVDIYITLVEKLSNEKFELQKQQLLHGERAFEEIKEVFNQQQRNFSEQFQRKFQQFVNHRKQPLTADSSARSDENVRSDQIQVALSSLLGGIGYFEGTSRIEWNVDELWDTIYPPNPNDPGNNPNETVVPIHQPAIENHPQHYTQLLTATPSRTIFPPRFFMG